MVVRLTLVAALSTPMGLQLNLYPMGLSAASGAGRPPHSDTKRVTFPPLPCRPLIKRSADMWSMPEGGGRMG